MSLLSFLQWLESTSFSTDLRESIYMWAIVNGTHVLGLGLFLGMLLFWDLRLLNAGFRGVPVSVTWQRLAPYIALGFGVMAVTGVLLFVSDPVRFWANVFFRVKLVLLLVAGLNAVAFHYWSGRDTRSLDAEPWTPTSARVAGAVSLAIWAMIVVCGRFIAYNWFDPLV